MENHRSRPVDISKAAERSGYFPREAELLASAPGTILNQGERSDVMHFGANVADKLVHLLDGKDVDWHELVRLGSQLRNMSPSENPDKHEDELELNFEEEQKLLLIKNLIEDAFFDGKLAHLHGQSAAALAFLINRVAKLVDNMTPLVRQDFLFDKQKMDALIEEAREAEQVDLLRRIEVLKSRKREVEDVIIESDPDWGWHLKGRRIDLEIDAQKYNTPELNEEESVMFPQLEALTEQVRINLDKYLPSSFPNKEGLRKVLNCLQSTTIFKNHLGQIYQKTSRLSRGIASDFITRTPSKWTYGDWKLDILQSISVLEQTNIDIAKLPDSKKAALQPLMTWLEMVLRSRSQELIAKLKVERELADVVIQYNEKLRELCDSNQAYGKKRDDAVLALKDAEDDVFFNKPFTNAINDYRGSKEGVYGEMQPHQFTADLYLMKAYLVAADMYNRQGEERTATADNKAGKDIFTYRFSDTGREDKGFADVHFKVTQAPLAEAMVRAQMRGEK